MPIYEYRCDQGHTFEVMQRMTEDPVGTCTTCSAPVQRVFHPVAVHFKGKGFYNTDYGTRKRQKESAASGQKEGAASTESGGGKSPSKDGGAKGSDSSSA